MIYNLRLKVSFFLLTWGVRVIPQGGVRNIIKLRLIQAGEDIMEGLSDDNNT